jgi:heme O synthase-like polyprenyltransferase
MLLSPSAPRFNIIPTTHEIAAWYSPAVSLVYATLLGIAGFMLLWFGANPLACWLGVMGFVVYVGVYSIPCRTRSVFLTLQKIFR